MTDRLDSALRPSEQVVESKVGDETVLLHLANGTYYGLDPVGTRIWSSIKAGVALPDTCRSLADEFGVDLATVEADARKFLADLEAQGIVVDG